ncbi:MAG: tetratricopeptide repeat protein [Planctomycetes bacterium]|nr:tetratricopeptide repeat protein [Planctomycetota bacterium]
MSLGTMLIIGAVVVFALSTIFGNADRRLPDPPVLADLSGLNAEAAALIQAKHKTARDQPHDVVARSELAMAYHANAILDEAAQTYRQASSLDPDNAKWWYLLGRIQKQNGELEAAHASLNRVLALDESYTPAQVRQGFWLLEQGLIDEAEASFTRAVALETDNRNGRIGLARIALQRDDSSDALETLVTLRRKHPTDRYIQYLLGMAYRQNGQIDLARAELAVGVGGVMSWSRLDPWTEEMLSFQTSFRADYDLAKKYLTAGKPSEAIPLLRKMTQEFPDNLPVIISLAGAHSGMNRFEEAVVILQRGLEIAPDHFALHLNLGSVYQRLNQLEPALKHTNEAIRLHPTLFNSHFQRAQILFMIGRLADAADSLKTTIEYDTKNQPAYSLLVVTLTRLNRFGELEETLKQMINFFPGTPDPHAMLASLYRELGRIEEARAIINRAMDLYPGNRQFIDMKNSLSLPSSSP